jgi:hypothetical protein
LKFERGISNRLEVQEGSLKFPQREKKENGGRGLHVSFWEKGGDVIFSPPIIARHMALV